MSVVTNCPDLTNRLLRAKRSLQAGADPDPYIAYAMAVLSAYAYSQDDATLMKVAAELGLKGYTYKKYQQFVDVMFIDSTAYLLRSPDGRVAILVYRGTNLESLINWLVDFEVDPEKVEIEFHDRDGTFMLHRGFHRNLLATFDDIVADLQAALGNPMAAADSNGEGAPEDRPLEALYITGHSLGAAMAAMATLLLRTEKRHERILDMLKPVHTYGQPMIGDHELANLCDEPTVLEGKLIRYVFGHDAAPQLPPRAAGDFAHFGREFRHPSNETVGDWREPPKNTGQLRSLLELALLIPSFLARQLSRTRRLPFGVSVDDHLPWHYIGTLTPDKSPQAPGSVGYGMSAPHSPSPQKPATSRRSPRSRAPTASR
jgi:Lipase (class 3)